MAFTGHPFTRNKSMTELSVSNRYITSDMSDDLCLLKFQAFSYYQGIMFWILEYIWPILFEDINAMAKVSIPGSR